jgi:hypothetical protein
LAYRSPGGTAGAALARLTGEEPDQQVREDLRRLKQVLECGEIVAVDERVSARGPVQRRVTQGKARGRILGHEFMGEVVEVGSEVAKVRPGDRVVVGSFIGCGACHYCQDELWSLCDNTNPAAAGAGEALGARDRRRLRLHPHRWRIPR